MAMRKVVPFADIKDAIARMKAEVPLVGVVEAAGVRLREEGSYLVGLCPFHSERTPSFKVDVQAQSYRCYGCGEHGDVLNFIQRHRSLSTAEVLVEYGYLTQASAGVSSGHRPAVEPVVTPVRSRDAYTVITPVPAEAPALVTRAGGFRALASKPPRTVPLRNPRKPETMVTLPVTFEHVYRDGAGNVLGSVVRADFRDPATGENRKLTPAITWARDADGAEGWTILHWPAPWPLYRLDALAAAGAEVPVLLLEGEKTADAAARLLHAEDYAVMTWCGGTNNTHAIDWTPLSGRVVVIWPDADHVGFVAAARIAETLGGLGCTVMVVMPPEGVAKGWDLADAVQEGWTRAMVLEQIDTALVDGAAWVARHREDLDAAPRAGRARQEDQSATGGQEAAGVIPFPAPDQDEPQATLDALLASAEEGDADAVDDGEDLLDRALELLTAHEPLPADVEAALVALRRAGDAVWLRWKVSAFRLGLDIEALEDRLGDLARQGDEQNENGEHEAVPRDGTRPSDEVPGADGAPGEDIAPDESAEGGRDTGDDRGGGDEAPPYDDHGLAAMPLRILGHRRGVYYYMPDETQEIVALKAEQHRAQQLTAMVPLAIWENAFGGERGVDWLAVANALMRAAHDAGLYNEDKVRGRGAWMEGNSLVFHLGDRLLIDGQEVGLHEYAGRYIYQQDVPLPLPDLADPLTDAEGQALIGLFAKLRWETPLSAWLMAGWVSTAPFCGALEWRPHAWVTGGSGSGKSWLMSRIVKPLLGPVALYIQSSSTEAGIRQYLGQDALPVLFDEAESEDDRARGRIQAVLELMRQASSETGGVILKGSASQIRRTYAIRSQFLMASIGIGLQQQSDINRVTILSLRQGPPKSDAVALAKAKEDFRILRKEVDDFVTDELPLRLFARMLTLIPVVRQNARVFADAGQVVFGSQRMGDQIGALLAGAHALISSEVVSFEYAQDFLESNSFGRFVEDGYAADHDRALAHLMLSPVRVDAGNNGSSQTRPVGELIDAVLREKDPMVTGELADATLRRHGLRVDLRKDVLIIHNDHAEIRKIMAGTPWAVNWNKQFIRLDGGQTVGPTRFTAGVVSRGVSIPLARVLGGDAEEA